MAQVFNKEKKAQIKSELEDLLRGYSGGPTGEEDIVDEQLSEIAAAPPLDFAEMNAGFERQAKDITNSMLKFYVDLGVIDKHEYLKQKQSLDNSNIQTQQSVKRSARQVSTYAAKIVACDEFTRQ